MLIKVSTANEIKNRFGSTTAIPKKNISIDTKNGFRETAKTPVFIISPAFLAFNPKRNEVLKSRNVNFIKRIENNISSVPVIFR